MLNCIAIDDEPMALEVIKAHSSKLSYINLVHTFTQVSKAKRHLKKFPVDLLFLDIQMPDANGIDFYRSLQQETMVVFTTAFSEYAVEGFNVNAVDYLLKPIDFERFRTTCEKAQDYFNYLNSSKNSNQQSLYVRSEYSLVKIPFEEILFLETMDDYIKIHCVNKPTVLTLSSMSKIFEKLPQGEFVRVHRSYTIPFSKITSVKGKSIFLNNIEIPLGNTYIQKFQRMYKNL